MFQYTYSEFKKLYAKYITEIWEESYTIMVTDYKEDYENEEYDLILVYSPLGELVILAKRMYKNKYPILRWLQVHVSQIFNKNKLSEDLAMTVKCHKGYTDIVTYKRWWLEWAKELL